MLTKFLTSLIHSLDQLNKNGKARSVATFDFSTLYTKIPHDKLINVLHKLIDSVFNKTNRTFIAVGNKRAYWVKKLSTKNPTFPADLLKQCVEFLMNNAFFVLGI